MDKTHNPPQTNKQTNKHDFWLTVVSRSTVSWIRLAKSPTQSAMTMSDNRRCPVQENTSRQKPERCSAETYHYRQPPTRTGPAALGQFVLEPFLLNSHLSAMKCVRSVSLSTRADLKHNHSPTAHTTPPNTSQPASQPAWRVTCLKGCVRACLKGRAACCMSPRSATEVRAVCCKYKGWWITIIQPYQKTAKCIHTQRNCDYTSVLSAYFLFSMFLLFISD